MTAVVLVVIIGLAVLLSIWLITTARRLNRLHIRVDAAWAALDAALARRAVVARAIAAAGCLDSKQIETLPALAEQAARADREVAENELTRALSTVDRAQLPGALVAELTDAEHRVIISRRMYSDAVRDTRAQRRRRVVRWCKIAGTAPQPEYFEIIEPDLVGQL